jgi:D-xylose transport system permease protein
MTDTSTESGGGAPSSPTAPSRNFLGQLELDLRLLGMVGAFAVVCILFNVLTGGRFLSPQNVFNLTIQTVSVAIMATGMVFVIVTRHIDLAVGALLATCSAVMAMLQVRWLPGAGMELGSPMIAWVAIAAGIGVGAVIGAFQGWLVGYLSIPAFIVTLGGLLVWRNVGWYLTSGQTIGPLNPVFQTLGGINGTLGAQWSWIVGLVAAVVTVALVFSGRASKRRHGFAVKPLWADVTVAAILAAAILGFVAILNAYQIPQRVLERQFTARGETMPEGFTASYGIPYSVLLLIAVAVVMTILARRTRFGRYVFATGGNPEAATLSGINTRWLTVKVFALMGALVGLSAVVASARLTNHSNDIGTLDELRVIAAAVIGGTAMVGVDSPLQNIVVGTVLVVAVLVDIVYRRRLGSS